MVRGSDSAILTAPGQPAGGEGNGAMFASGMGNDRNAAFYDNRNRRTESQNLIPPSDSDRLESQGSAFLEKEER